MPQARLPDVGHAFDAYRKKAIDNIKNNHTDCIGSLYSLNGLLPEEYRIQISSIEYEKKMNLETEVKCTSCQAQTNMKDVKMLNCLVSLIKGLISGSDYEKIWVCPKCKKENKLMNTTIIKKIPKEPYLLKVVPPPPMRKDGLMDRRSYNKNFEQWAWTFINELEAEMARFRDDNWNRGDDEMKYDDIDTTLEDYPLGS